MTSMTYLEIVLYSVNLLLERFPVCHRGPVVFMLFILIDFNRFVNFNRFLFQ